MPVRGVTVLLVGNGARSAPTLENHLRKRGCDICFATSKKEAMEILQSRRLDLILSEFMLPDGTAYQLMAPLLGTGTTMFVSNTVENGCWWMTALFQGQDRSREPGMRPGEFRIRFEELLHDKLLRSANNCADSLTNQRKYVPPGIDDQSVVSDAGREPGSLSNHPSPASGHAES